MKKILQHKFGALARVSACIMVLTMSGQGCGSHSPIRSDAPVVGTVTYRGKSLSHGQIAMIHQSGQIAASEIQPDGSYQLKAIVGENRIMIECTDRPNLSQISPRSGRLLQPAKSLIPARYNDYASSGLTMNVIAGANTHDWHLSD